MSVSGMFDICPTRYGSPQRVFVLLRWQWALAWLAYGTIDITLILLFNWIFQKYMNLCETVWIYLRSLRCVIYWVWDRVFCFEMIKTIHHGSPLFRREFYFSLSVGLLLPLIFDLFSDFTLTERVGWEWFRRGTFLEFDWYSLR